ncbi:hypothetical protein D3C77_293140 [compost metagenome]
MVVSIVAKNASVVGHNYVNGYVDGRVVSADSGYGLWGQSGVSFSVPSGSTYQVTAQTYPDPGGNLAVVTWGEFY